mmetsp:Transcript_6391/g.27159  ORF Transcript_6391/g.27159 Transcript_6391/m.27159 type:complete len:85 (-) Transcript_6391:385-639(-)
MADYLSSPPETDAVVLKAGPPVFLLSLPKDTKNAQQRLDLLRNCLPSNELRRIAREETKHSHSAVQILCSICPSKQFGLFELLA